MKFFIKFFEWVWLRGIKNWWSKLRWWKQSSEPSVNVPAITDTNLLQACRNLYNGFNWHMDNAYDLFDTYMPAPYAYNRCVAWGNNEAGKLEGDCDDFHGAVLNMLDFNKYDAALITLATIPITQSHTMTIYKKNEKNTIKYYIINYIEILGPYSSIKDFIQDYNVPVRYWCLQKYNYRKGKYYNIKKTW